MKSVVKIAPYIVIVALVVFILHLKGCFETSSPSKKEDKIKIEGKDYQVIKKEIDTVYLVKKEIIYKKGKDIPYEVEVVREIPADVDTASILKDYHARVFYRDTFKLKDTLGYLVINDTITENRIASRGFESTIRIPTIKETVYLKPLSRDLYFGPSLQIGNSISLGADAHLKTKEDLLIGLGIGINSSVSPYLRGSVSWKINK